MTDAKSAWAELDDEPIEGLLDPDALVREAFLAGFEPPPEMTVSEWADLYRIVAGHSPDEGKYRTSRTPYAREIMDCLSVNHPAERVIFMKGSQIGGSEIGMNWLGYVIHQAPGPMLMVYPRHADAHDESRDRVEPMIDLTEQLRELVGPAHARLGSNTLLRKEFPGGSVRMVGANSPASFRRISIRWLFPDECDAYPMEVGDEGSPLELAIKRTAVFEGRNKIYLPSTPTIKDHSVIEAEYNLSDKRVYLVPCPHCGFFQQITWAQIKWPEGQPDEAALECLECHTLIEEHHKTSMLAGGKWVATAPGDGVRIGFHLNALYSPVGWFSWRRAVRDFLDAKAKGREELKVWTNTVLAETWEEKSDLVDPDTLEARCKPYPACPGDGGEGDAERCPKGVLVLVAGVDVQDDRIELEVVGYGKDEESWGIHYRRLMGDPGGKDLWDRLDEALQVTYPHEDGYRLRIEHACIDSGGHYTQKAYRFCRNKETRGVFAVKGAAGPGRPIAAASMRKRTGRGRRPFKLFIVGADQARMAVRKDLLIQDEGPRYCHFPVGHGYTHDYFQQLTVWRRRPKYTRGVARWEWEKPSGARDEAFSCRIYALAALDILTPDWAPLARNRAKKAATAATAAGRTAPPPSASPPASDPPPPSPSPPARTVQMSRPRRPGWVSGWR